MTPSFRSAEIFYRRLSALPVVSAQKLQQINDASTSAQHVVLALRYGLTDTHIRALNKTIIGLLLSRLRAERARNQNLIGKINETMLGLHLAIDWVTGVQVPYSAQPIERGSCNGLPKRNPI